MSSFETLHADAIRGKLTGFDRLIFKGYLTSFYGYARPKGGGRARHRFESFLASQGVLLKDFRGYVERVTERLKAHAEEIARRAGRPLRYLDSAHTHASDESKEALARAIAAQDKVTKGLVCVFSVLELCSTLTVRGNRETHHLEVVPRRSKCLHFYFYLIDPEFGWMHVRIQSWFPLTIQVYINGREWLARRMDEAGLGYRRHDNTFTEIEDLPKAQRWCDALAHRKWPRVLDVFARRVNPLLPRIERAGSKGYYWVLDQGEVATDVMFRDRPSLEKILPDLFEHALVAYGAEDILRFLGRRLRANFDGEVTTSHLRRPEGRRIKHRMKRNSLKFYDKASVLRIETTINNPREFKVLRVRTTPDGERQRRWCPMGKGVANLWRFREVGTLANERYLEALAQADRKGEAVRELDGLCRSRIHDGRRIPRFEPLARDDLQLFQAALSGDHVLNGFRNRDLRQLLYPHPPASPQDALRRCARISRLIAKLRGHSLVAKVHASRLYRVTPRGYHILAAILEFHRLDYPRLRKAG